MKSLLIVEDEKMIRQGLRVMIQRSGVPVDVILECKNGEEALAVLETQRIDVMFTDIRMPRMDGIELTKRVQELAHPPLIVAVSGYDDFSYAVEMLRNGVREYLLKPVDKNKLFAVLDRYADRHKAYRRVILPVGDESVCVNSDDIVYLEAFGKKTQVTLWDGKEVICTCGLSTTAEKLGKDFVPCHRSYIVNIGYISSISKTEVTMDSGKKIPVSRRLYDSVNRAFIAYYKENRE